MKDFIEDEILLEKKRNEIKELLKLKKLNEANALIRSLNYYQIFENPSYKLECLELLCNSNKFDSLIFEKLFKIIGYYAGFLNKIKVLSEKEFHSSKYCYVMNIEDDIDYDYKVYKIKTYVKNIPKIDINVINSEKYKEILNANMKNLSIKCIEYLIVNEDLTKELIEEDKEGNFSIKVLKILNEKKEINNEKNIKLMNLILTKSIKDYFEKKCVFILRELKEVKGDLFKEDVAKYCINNINYLMEQRLNRVIDFKNITKLKKIKIKYQFIKKNINNLLNSNNGYLNGIEVFCCIFGVTPEYLFETLENEKFWNLKKIKERYEKERCIINLENF